MCNSPGLYYTIQSDHTPICIGSHGSESDSSGSRSGSDVCYSDPSALICIYDYISQVDTDTDANQHQIYLQTVYGDSQPLTYFNFATTILILAVLILLYLCSYDPSKTGSDRNYNDGSGLYWMTVALEFIMGILMLLSAGSFTVMQNVPCPVDSIEASAACLQVSGCDMRVKSILMVDDIFVFSYSSITVALVVGHFLVALYELVISKKLHSMVVPFADVEYGQEGGPGPQEREEECDEIIQELNAQIVASRRTRTGQSTQVLVTGTDSVSHRHDAHQERVFGLIGNLVRQRQGDEMDQLDLDQFAYYDRLDNRTNEYGDRDRHRYRNSHRHLEEAMDGLEFGSGVSYGWNDFNSRYVENMATRQNLVKHWKYYDSTGGERPSGLGTGSGSGSGVGGDQKNESQTECAICLCDLCPSNNTNSNTNTTAIALVQVPCSHWFHRDCLLTWIATKRQENGVNGVNTCPVCRADLSNGNPNPISNV